MSMLTLILLTTRGKIMTLRLFGQNVEPFPSRSNTRVKIDESALEQSLTKALQLSDPIIPRLEAVNTKHNNVHRLFPASPRTMEQHPSSASHEPVPPKG